jgi:hypothetical protein
MDIQYPVGDANINYSIWKKLCHVSFDGISNGAEEISKLLQ